MATMVNDPFAVELIFFLPDFVTAGSGAGITDLFINQIVLIWLVTCLN